MSEVIERQRCPARSATEGRANECLPATAALSFAAESGPLLAPADMLAIFIVEEISKPAVAIARATIPSTG